MRTLIYDLSCQSAINKFSPKCQGILVLFGVINDFTKVKKFLIFVMGIYNIVHS